MIKKWQVVGVLVVGFLAGGLRAEKPSGFLVRKADMKALLRAETRMVEVKRLMGLGEHDSEVTQMTQEEWEGKMADVRLVECPQPGARPLYLLMLRQGEDYYSSGDLHPILDRDVYPREGLDELFKLKAGGEAVQGEVGNTDHLSPSDSMRLEDYELCFFDADGREQHPFGGDNYITSGYLFDMNGDGVLEVLDATHWGVSDGDSVASITLKTVELKPSILLSVVYEWHPDSASERNEWTYSMRDMNGDGVADVVLGPRSEDSGLLSEVVVSYVWDASQKAYIGPAGEKGDHFRRLSNSKPWKELQQLKGLGYPVLLDEEEIEKVETVTSEEVMARPLHPLPDLATMDMDGILAFFDLSNTEKDPDEKGFPVVFPKGLERMRPQDAALAYAEANRDAGHRAQYQLAVDDRQAVQVPRDGWLVYSQHSASCYTYIEKLWAISLEASCLVYCTNSRHGVVGANPYLDEVGYDIRVIDLEPGEARFLADMLWWLDRIRSRVLEKGVDSHSGQSSADGGCSLYWHQRSKVVPYYTDQVRWFGFSAGPSSRWEGDYSREVCGNLAGDFCEGYIPRLLGERWSRSADLKHRNLTTSDQERLKQRHDEQAVEAVRHAFEKVFEMHRKGSVPAELLGWVARASGDLGLKALKPSLFALQQSLGERSAQEREYEALCKQLEGKELPQRFAEKMTPAERALEKQFDRQFELETALRYDFRSYLRPRLRVSLEKIELISRPGRLVDKALSGKGDAYWAQKELRRRYPEEYADVLMEMLRRAPDEKRKEQAMELLLAFSPEKGLELFGEMDEGEKAYFCLSFIGLIKKHRPGMMPRMLRWVSAKASDPETSWQHRHRAVRYLTPEYFADHEEVVYPLLMRIAKEKPVKSEGYSPHPHSACITSLASWTRAGQEWSILKKLAASRTGDSWNEEELMEALASLSTRCGPDARKEVQAIVESRLLNGSGLVDSRIEFIVELGYRECLPLIERMATRSAEESQSRWAVSGRGSGSFATGRGSYHAARHARAMWREWPPEVQARVWAAKAVVSPEWFVKHSGAEGVDELNRLGHLLVEMLRKQAGVKEWFLNRSKLQESWYPEQVEALRGFVGQAK